MKTRPALITILAVSVVAPVLAQGPLTPPGAPAPTMKTLAQIEPRIEIDATNTPGSATALHVITQPGSYYLAGNLGGVEGKNGIFINANNVTIDLMGFTLEGNVPSSLDGITCGSVINIAVMNGNVKSWGGDGIDLYGNGTSVSNVRLEGIQSASNGGAGLRAGRNSIVKNCTVFGNDGASGIETGEGGTITGCTARSNNDGMGIRASNGSTVTNCTSTKNGGNNGNPGISAILGTVNGCTANENGGNGIVAQTVSNCTAYANGGVGISSVQAVNCTAKQNSNGGITGRTVTGCNAESNGGTGIGATTAVACHAENNGFHGISANVVSDCEAIYNDADGITAPTVKNSRAAYNSGDGIQGSMVTGCFAESNGGHGISISNAIHDTRLARDNACSLNGTGASGGAGIYFSLDGVRIEGNNCYSNDWGIQGTTGTDCFIVRNSCRNNGAAPVNGGPSGNFDFPATNTFGPIVVISGDLSASATASNPWANINY